MKCPYRYILCEDDRVTAEEATDAWVLAEAAGPPRTECRWLPTQPDPELPIRILVGIMFECVSADGMPVGEAEHDALRAVDQALVSELPRYGARLVLVVTWQGAREWIAYASSADWLDSWAPDFAERCLKPRVFQIDAAHDLGWSTYLSFADRRVPDPEVVR
jgi:hypothetical protein